ncbi:tRNA (guanosine(37)-N1)-methyltransferase TrmD [Marinicella meishanensis]|uniref:tRNA (guanosine(37)-N1)-methyltransferase TrmD n=1 Tax=Marinicella meishanensis TaxID=2873263 RepID=UPI001CBB8220|nr:tRNA (guanosine(37)-N1)-methyltransferase TrmD [Marinicella sp. NBU2979]
MHINVLTLFPQMVEDALSYGVIGKAIEQGLVTVKCINPRDFAENKHQRVDDKPFGGGPGMVMMYDPLFRALRSIGQTAETGPVLCMSPQGDTLCQHHCNEWAQLPQITLVCGRYEGIDQRFIEAHVDQEISIGDYVISGGEMAACVVIDATIRQLAGVLGDSESAETDSFMTGQLGMPQYTRSELLGQSGVPAVLLSGHHQAIDSWRQEQAKQLTQHRRPDLLEGTSEGH